MLDQFLFQEDAKDVETTHALWNHFPHNNAVNHYAQDKLSYQIASAKHAQMEELQTLIREIASTVHAQNGLVDKLMDNADLIIAHQDSN